jgi:hypothetical protein
MSLVLKTQSVVIRHTELDIFVIPCLTRYLFNVFGFRVGARNGGGVGARNDGGVGARNDEVVL